MTHSSFVNILAIFLICAGPAFSQTTPMPSVPMTNDEAVAFVKGKSLSTTRVAGGSPYLQFKEDGTMYGSNNGSDSGKWRVEDGKLCMAWRRWEYEGCGQLVKVGNEVHHLYPNGTAVHLIFR